MTRCVSAPCIPCRKPAPEVSVQGNPATMPSMSAGKLAEPTSHTSFTTGQQGRLPSDMRACRTAKASSSCSIYRAGSTHGESPKSKPPIPVKTLATRCFRDRCGHWLTRWVAKSVPFPSVPSVHPYGKPNNHSAKCGLTARNSCKDLPLAETACWKTGSHSKLCGNSVLFLLVMKPGLVKLPG